MVHELKALPEYFDAVLAREKTFEIRKNDRGFSDGDTVILKKYTKDKGYSGHYAKARITYLTDYSQKDSYVVFAIKLESSGFNHEYAKEEK